MSVILRVFSAIPGRTKLKKKTSWAVIFAFDKPEICIKEIKDTSLIQTKKTTNRSEEISSLTQTKSNRKTNELKTQN